MKTVRKSTFETNSSSCHAVTILSDKEYNSIKEGKAFIYNNGYKVITKEDIKKTLEKDIAHKRRLIEHIEDALQKVTSNVDLKDIQFPIPIHINKNTSPEGIIKTLKDCNETFKADLASLESMSIDRLYEKIIIASKHLDILGSLDSETYQEDVDEDISKSEYYFVDEYLQDYADLNTYGGDNDVDYNTRTIDGVPVHVLSYAELGY